MQDVQTHCKSGGSLLFEPGPEQGQCRWARGQQRVETDRAV